MTKIRALRLALYERNPGVGTLTAVARAVGVRAETVRSWEQGVNRPSPRHLRALAKVLGVSVSELEGGA